MSSELNGSVSYSDTPVQSVVNDSESQSQSTPHVFQEAVLSKDVQTLCKYLNDKDLYDNVVSGCGDLLGKAEEVVSEWRQSQGVGDVVDIWQPQYKQWYCAKITDKVDESTYLVHYLGWHKKFDEKLVLSDCNFLPPHTMTRERKKPAGKKPRRSSIVIEIVPNELENGNNGSVESNGIPEATEVGGKRLRKRQSEPLSETSSQVGSASKRGRRRSSTKSKDEDGLVEQSEWVCNICYQLEAPDDSDLLICEGGCRRPFHMGCLGFSKEEQQRFMEAQSESWICSDCQAGRHTCFICNDEGDDGKEVVRCGCGHCGKYYHFGCLTTQAKHYHIHRKKNSVESSLPSEHAPPAKADQSSNNGMSKRVIRRPCRYTDEIEEMSLPEREDDEVEGGWGDLELVKCPHHYCDTCHEFYRNEKGLYSRPLFKCFRCPKAFHVNCIPPDARYNAHLLLCGDHKDEALPALEVVPREAVEGKGSSFSYVYDQLPLPTSPPSVSELAGSHFRFPLSLKKDISAHPPPFKMIFSNDYEPLRRNEAEDGPAEVPVGVPMHTPDVACSCVSQCSEDCLNRISKIECCEMGSSSICAVGKGCGNRLFTNREYVKVQPFQEGEMGWGLRAREDVSCGSLVIEYVGEVVTEAQMRRRMTMQRKLSPSDHDFYVMEIENGLYVDGKRKGNLSRFINHSCDPNCELVRWVVRGRMRIGIFAIKDIQSGDSLSYDYQFDTQESEAFKCHCGAATCRGTMAPKKKSIGSKDMLSRADRQRMIAAGRRREDKETLRQEEWKRSFTGRMLPGDGILEVKNGPPRVCLVDARDQHLFLVRNTRNGMDFVKRRHLMSLKASSA